LTAFRRKPLYTFRKALEKAINATNRAYNHGITAYIIHDYEDGLYAITDRLTGKQKPLAIVRNGERIK